jgi:hypothetical protein
VVRLHFIATVKEISREGIKKNASIADDNTYLYSRKEGMTGERIVRDAYMQCPESIFQKVVASHLEGLAEYTDTPFPDYLPKVQAAILTSNRRKIWIAFDFAESLGEMYTLKEMFEYIFNVNMGFDIDPEFQSWIESYTPAEKDIAILEKARRKNL